MRKRNLIFILFSSICAIGVYFSLDFKKDYSKISIEDLHTLAQNDDAEAQFVLGSYY